MIMRPLLLVVLLALPSCGVIGALTKATTPLDAYELRGNLPAVQPSARGQLHLIVEPPVVAASLDTDRILIRPNGLQAQYMPDGRWTDPPSKMLQTALVRELDAAGKFAYVGRTPLGPGGDYALLTEIIAFEAQLDATGNPSTHVRLLARLVRERDLAIAATRVFATTVPVPTTATPDLVRGLDAALSQITAQMTDWTLSAL